MIALTIARNKTLQMLKTHCKTSKLVLQQKKLQQLISFLHLRDKMLYKKLNTNNKQPLLENMKIRAMNALVST